MMSDNIIGKTAEIRDRLKYVNVKCDSIILRESLDELLSYLSNNEGAKMCTAITFALATLLFVGLNSKGVELSGHPVMHDIDRIKALVKQIKQVEADHEDRRETKKPKLDSQAAQRFVQHHIRQ